jgi:hypothetical protein
MSSRTCFKDNSKVCTAVATGWQVCEPLVSDTLSQLLTKAHSSRLLLWPFIAPFKRLIAHRAILSRGQT